MFGRKKEEQVELRTDADGVVWRITTYPKKPSKAVKVNDPNFVQERIPVSRALQATAWGVWAITVAVFVYTVSLAI